MRCLGAGALHDRESNLERTAALRSLYDRPVHLGLAVPSADADRHLERELGEAAAAAAAPWLDERNPDVVCLQETKLADDPLLDLLGDELKGRGYEVAVHGEAS